MNAAIKAGKNWSLANTTVTTEDGVSVVHLHGNKIAEVGDNFIVLFDGGWQSNTTKSRLNAILREHGCPGERVFQQNFQWFVSMNGFVIHALDNHLSIVRLELGKLLVSHVKNAVVNVWAKCNSDQQVRCSESTQSHTRAKLSDKEFSAIVETNEPLKVLLIYTFASNTMLAENSIQARLSGVRLPTTIVKFDAIVINLSNQIAMQVDIRNAVNIQHLSVSILPIFASSDSGIHLAFDLTHESRCCLN